MADNILTQPRSKWGFAVPSKRLINHQVKEQNKQQLLQEASSLVPDHQKLSEALLNEEMHTADMMRQKAQLDSVTADYTSNYAKNPFYSFSKEARDKAKVMFSIVNNPMNKQLSEQFARDKAMLETAHKDKINQNINVNQEGILVASPVFDDAGNPIDFEVRRKRRLEEGDKPLTLDETYKYIDQREGGAGGGFNYEMSSDDTVLNNLDKAFQGLGDTKIKRDIIEEGRQVMQSNNRVQLNNRIAWFASQGVTQADLNNLYAKYMKESGDMSLDNAKKYAIKYIADYAEGKRESISESEFFPEVRKALTGTGEGGAGGPSRESPEALTSAFYGGGVRAPLMLSTAGGTTLVENAPVVRGVLENAPVAYQEDGIQYKDLRAKSLPVLSALLPSGGYVMNIGEKNGQFNRIDPAAIENAVVSDDPSKPLQMAILPIDPTTGAPANVDHVHRIQNLDPKKRIPEDLKKYFRTATANDMNRTHADGTPVQVGDAILNQGYFQKATVLVGREKNIGGIPNKYKLAEQQLSSAGYQAKEDVDTMDRYNRNSGQKEKLTTPWFGANDGVYEVDLFLPVTNVSPYMETKARIGNEGLMLGPGTNLSDPSRPVRSVREGQIENQVINKSRYPTFPNK